MAVNVTVSACVDSEYDCLRVLTVKVTMSACVNSVCMCVC